MDIWQIWMQQGCT